MPQPWRRVVWVVGLTLAGVYAVRLANLALEVRTDALGQPVRRRYVDEIVAVQPGEDGPAHTHVFRRGGVPGVLPDEYRALADHGFDLAGYVQATAAGLR